MRNPNYYLIHANIAVAREALDHPIMADFVEIADEIDEIAHNSPGFVAQPTPRDEGSIFKGKYLLNLSIWDTVESLRDFTYSNAHKLALTRREDWFIQGERYNYVLYWSQRESLPTEKEIKARIDYLRFKGPSPYAFTFDEAYSLEDALDHGLDRTV